MGACDDPACAEHGAALRSSLGLPPPPPELLPSIDAAALVKLAHEWDERATALETDALIAHTGAVDVEPGEAWASTTAAMLEDAAADLRDAHAIRTCRSELVRLLAFAGIGLALFVAGCVAPAGGIDVTEACDQYEAETEGAPCFYPCPWDGEGTCDVEAVSRCASAVWDACDTATPTACDAACEAVRR